MFLHMPPKERVIYVLLVCAFLFGAGYVGARRMHQTPKIVFQDGQSHSGLKLSPLPMPSLAPSPSPPASSQVLIVDVVGAVRKSGLVKLGLDARVNDAVAAAGGATSDADLDSLNLAAKVEDGQQIVVSRKGESNSLPVVLEMSPKGKGGSKHPARPLNVNTASAEELQQLPGVGPAMAQRIVDYRKQHGHIASVDELSAIKGFGHKRADRIRLWIRT